MKVRTSFTHALDEPGALDHLARVVQAIGDGWHDWIGPDPEDVSLQTYFEHYDSHRELLVKSYTNALLYPLKAGRTVVLADEAEVGTDPTRLADETTLRLATGSLLLTSALPIVVENEVNDGAFYLRLIGVVDPDLVQLGSEPRAPFKFDNGGGKTVIRALVRHRGERARAAGLPLRLLVIIDSDSRYPGHQDSDTEKLRTVCQEEGAALFVLEKRSIENYVTDPVIDEMTRDDQNTAAAAQLIKSLPPVVRDHYPIKKGIPVAAGKACVKTDGERDLYEPVQFPEDAQLRLSGAAARFVATDHTHTTAELEDRGCLLEVEAMAQWIREEL